MIIERGSNLRELVNELERNSSFNVVQIQGVGIPQIKELIRFCEEKFGPEMLVGEDYGPWAYFDDRAWLQYRETFVFRNKEDALLFKLSL